MSTEEIIKVGPAGSTYGRFWEEKDLSRLSEIYISHGYYIRCIQFGYYRNGVLVISQPHGQKIGCKYNVVRLNYPSEFITGISGDCFLSYLGSITFVTNQGWYGPFGCPSNFNLQFDYQFGDYGQFLGLFGYYSSNRNYITGIGFYVKPTTLRVVKMCEKSKLPIKSKGKKGHAVAKQRTKM